jgi:hypothetical protein
MDDRQSILTPRLAQSPMRQNPERKQFCTIENCQFRLFDPFVRLIFVLLSVQYLFPSDTTRRSIVKLTTVDDFDKISSFRKVMISSLFSSKAPGADSANSQSTER